MKTSFWITQVGSNSNGKCPYKKKWDFPGGLGFPDSSVGKDSTCNAGDPGLIPGSGRSPGEGIAYPLRDSWTSLVAQLVESTCNAGDLGSIPGLGRSPQDIVDDTSVRSWILNYSLRTIVLFCFVFYQVLTILTCTHACTRTTHLELMKACFYIFLEQDSFWMVHILGEKPIGKISVIQFLT